MAEFLGEVSVKVIPDNSEVIAGLETLASAYLDLYARTIEAITKLKESNDGS